MSLMTNPDPEKEIKMCEESSRNICRAALLLKVDLEELGNALPANHGYRETPGNR